jgi:hypothetical protein
LKLLIHNTCKYGHLKSDFRLSPKGLRICRICERNRRNKYYNSHKEERAKLNALNDRRLRRNLRDQLIQFFGAKCIKCGFTDKRALQIDHIYGGGTKENKTISRHRMSKNILSNAPGYQLLCANCNAIKRYESKEIPMKYPEVANA